jgi:outer membrane protein OmpA-like peptidoglycan-associated protein
MTRRRAAALVLATPVALVALATSGRAQPTPGSDGLVRGTWAIDPATAQGVTGEVRDIGSDVLDIVTDVETKDGSTGVASGSTTTTVTVSADVLFAFDKADLTPVAQAKLRIVAQELRDGHASGQVLVGGHADSKGEPGYNLVLSERRAQAVVAALRPLIAGLQVTLVPQGYGDTKPVAPNTLKNGKDNPTGRKLNRRVTLEFSHPER